MRQYKPLTPAFTMIELVFVIIILGIVASLGSEMIVKVYQSYILQKAEHRATVKTELAATQIANRLASVIPGTAIRKLTRDATAWEYLNEAMVLDPNGDYNVLQWVGSDTDSFNINNSTNTKIGWSGFCDINISSKSSISTPGSDLSLVNTIRTNLGSPSNFAIYFPYDLTAYFGSGTTNIITLDNNTSHVVEHYKMARTSYALVTEANAEGGEDLYLYYNFSPSPVATIGNIKSLILKNISTFKFKGAGRTIRFKLCKDENIGEDFNITACKEKAVF